MKCPYCKSIHSLSKEDSIHKCSMCPNIVILPIPIQENRHQVFICYSHSDTSELAENLAIRLRERGHYVFRDIDYIKGNDPWPYKIETALQNMERGKENDNPRFIILLSPNAVRNFESICMDELYSARARQLGIIPIMVEDSSIPFCICSINYINVIEQWKNRKLRDIIDVIIEPTESKEHLDVLRNSVGSKHLKNILNPKSYFTERAIMETKLIGRKWLINKIKEWCNNTSHKDRILWITAGVGFGKSTFSFNMIKGIYINVKSFHICSEYNKNEYAEINNIIKSIAYYLYDGLSPLKRERLNKKLQNALDFITNEKDISTTTLINILLVEPLHQLQTQEQLIIWIDGVDETTINRQNTVMNFLLSGETLGIPSWIKFIVMSRPDEVISQGLLNARKLTHINLDHNKYTIHNNKDIEEYIDYRFQNHTEFKVFGKFEEFMAVRKSDIYKEVKERIIQNANGMFLYVSSICDDIINHTIDIQDINIFPSDINAIYTSFFNRIDESKIEIIKKILEIIVVAYRPLKKEEISKFIKNNDECEEVLALLQPLIKCDNSGYYNIFHTSLREWLLSEDNTKYKITSSKGLNIICDYLVQSHGLGISEYYAKYVVKHLFEQITNALYSEYAKIVDNIIQILSDSDSYELRKNVIGEDMMIHTYINELEQFSKLSSSNKKIVDDLFNREGCVNILYNNRQVLSDKALYVELKKMGLNFPILINDIGNEKKVVVTLRYWYANGNFNLIYNNRLILEKISLDEGINYDLMGLTAKKLGYLDKAVEYLKQSIKINESNDCTEDNVYIYVNIARIETINLNFDIAKELWCNANDIFETIPSNNSFAYRQLGIALKYVAIENELYSPIPNLDDCWRNICWFEELYSDEIRRDRYYTRHLQISALYYMIKKENKIAKDKLNECNGFIKKGSYENIKHKFFTILLKYITNSNNSSQSDIESLVRETKRSNLPIEYAETSALEATIKKSTIPETQTKTLKMWSEYIYKFIIHLTNKKN